jgi:hypothetical protein
MQPRLSPAGGPARSQAAGRPWAGRGPTRLSRRRSAAYEAVKDSRCPGPGPPQYPSDRHGANKSLVTGISRSGSAARLPASQGLENRQVPIAVLAARWRNSRQHGAGPASQGLENRQVPIAGLAARWRNSRQHGAGPASQGLENRQVPIAGLAARWRNSRQHGATVYRRLSPADPAPAGRAAQASKRILRFPKISLSESEH